MTVGSTVDVRTGPRYWAAGFTSMVRFEMINMRGFLITALLIQVLMGAGMTLMYGYYFGDLTLEQKTLIVTGIPALALVPIGFAVVPSLIMQHKLQDTYDYVWSLPVPRLASAAATFSIFTALAIPGTVLSLVLASVVLGVDLRPSAAIVVAILLTSSMATSVGYAMGHAIPEPRTINLLSNLLLFLVLLFSPIVVAIEQFPQWWATIHRVLPFWHMSIVLRAGVTEGLVTTSVSVSYAVLIGWVVGSWALVGWVVAKRR